jgi:SAM-dependent methyltransferase
VKDVPADYYRRLHEVDTRHWWHLGMRSIEAALLAGRMSGSLLDAGCGTGGFLAWAGAQGGFTRLCGVDVSAEAIELARETVPGAELQVAPLDRLPFADGEFDLVVCNDVLQHVPESASDASLRELRRVLRAGGTLLVRTNGERRARRERDDWRAYDAASLAADLRRAGLAVRRVTYANAVLSAAAAARGRRPHAPTSTSSGIPRVERGAKAAIGGTLLALEARYLASTSARLPYGHTLFALAEREPLP